MTEDIIAWQVQDQNTSRSIKAKICDASCTISTRDLSTYEGSFNCDVIQDAADGLRRLTPSECEALQGFPVGYTEITFRGHPSTDRMRYKAIGNSMAVSCMQWIAERIGGVEAF